MSFGYKDTEAAMHAYTVLLSSIKISNGIFAKIHTEILQMILEVFSRLLLTKSLDRQDEFLHDIEMFAQDMKRKYSTSSPYGWSPRSPLEKRLGISSSKKATKKLKKQEYDNDYYALDDFSV